MYTCIRNDSACCVVWWSFTFHLWLWQGAPFFCPLTSWTRQTQWATGLRSCIKVACSVPGHPCSWSKRSAVVTISSLPNQVHVIRTPFKGVFIGILYLYVSNKTPPKPPSFIVQINDPHKIFCRILSIFHKINNQKNSTFDFLWKVCHVYNPWIF